MEVLRPVVGDEVGQCPIVISIKFYEVNITTQIITNLILGDITLFCSLVSLSDSGMARL